MSAPRRPEVLIVGGGPAGLVAALALRRAGREVVVLERRPVGIDSGEAHQGLDKPCGEGLMPDAVVALERLGVDLDGVGVPFRGIAWIDGELRAEGGFPDRPGRGVRRRLLHRRLWQAAASCGAELQDGEPVLSTELEGAEWRLQSRSGNWRPGLVVAADGLRSPLRRLAALERRAAPPERWRFGVRRHFACPAWSDRVEVYWQRGVEAYVTPIAADEVGVALLFRPAEHQGSGPVLDRLLALFPALEERLAEAEPTSAVRGTGPLHQRARASSRGNLALVGDASGYLDAITGEGMAVAFAQARLLERALRRGSLQDYGRDVSRLVRRPNLLTHLALLLSARPTVRRRVLRALAREPRLFDRLLAIHVGAGSGLGMISSAVRLGWRLAWPAYPERSSISAR